MRRADYFLRRDGYCLLDLLLRAFILGIVALLLCAFVKFWGPWVIFVSVAILAINVLLMRFRVNSLWGFYKGFGVFHFLLNFFGGIFYFLWLYVDFANEIG